MTKRPQKPYSGVMENSAVMEQLVESHRKFLAFLEKRVESREVAEDILQAAFVRGLESGAELREEENAVAWFYRILRNAVIDHYRQRGASARALETWGREFAERPEADVRGEICGCLGGLIDGLKAEYREALQVVDLGEGSLRELAERASITEGNAAVRVHRARAALRAAMVKCCGTCAEHGCVECGCSR
ncbi:MAG: sigma-70 family RNA polymerase sigma factor [Acidobacteria bacterium]|nr:sigma-70 family RNA polymerase sigma factor [Acidobacteriota bacterium]